MVECPPSAREVVDAGRLRAGSSAVPRFEIVQVPERLHRASTHGEHTLSRETQKGYLGSFHRWYSSKPCVSLASQPYSVLHEPLTSN